MTLYEIIFSPTGGTKSVADALARGFGQNVCVIDLCTPDFDPSSASITSDDICIIAVPSYGGRVPALAISRLSQLKGCGARTILAAVYGNREFEDTLLELNDSATAAGFVPFAAVSAVAEHSIDRQIATGRPDAEDIAKLTKWAQSLATAVADGDFPVLHVPGNFPYKDSKGSTAKPIADDRCIRCGLCAEKCPTSAIPARQPEQTDAVKCISCMRCINICPTGARALPSDLMAGIHQMLSKVASGYKSNQIFFGDSHSVL